MDRNAIDLQKLIPDWPIIDRISQLGNRDLQSNALFASAKWLRARNPQLPENWSVTSDSIAAALASEIGASNLVLLKSKDGPNSGRLADATAVGYVDDYFETAIGDLTQRQPNLTIRFVNLRSKEFDEQTLKLETPQAPQHR